MGEGLGLKLSVGKELWCSVQWGFSSVNAGWGWVGAAALWENCVVSVGELWRSAGLFLLRGVMCHCNHRQKKVTIASRFMSIRMYDLYCDLCYTSFLGAVMFVIRCL